MMEIDHFPNKKPPKPVRAPLLSPEINMQLNVTPEKVSREQFLREEQNHKSCYVVARDNALCQPQMNTTAIVTQKIKELNETKFDAPNMIRQQLKKSDKLRQDIAEKASEALNYNLKDSMYPGLISLDVSASDLTLQQRKVFKEKKVSENRDEPDITTFMSDDLEYESSSLSCHCVSESTKLELFCHPSEDVFKLYELMECWNR